MAKADSIHPKYRKIKIVETNGNVFEVGSTYTKSDTLELSVDKHTHPAWKKGTSYVNKSVGEISKFSQKYSGLSFLSGSSEEKKEEN
jgi:large subunit ribosomal protein L31